MTPSDKLSSCLCWALAKQVVLHSVDFSRSSSQWTGLVDSFRWCAHGSVSAGRCAHTVGAGGSNSWRFFCSHLFCFCWFSFNKQIVGFHVPWTSEMWMKWKRTDGIMLTNVKLQKRNWKVVNQSEWLPARLHCTITCAVDGTHLSPRKLHVELPVCRTWLLLWVNDNKNHSDALMCPLWHHQKAPSRC